MQVGLVLNVNHSFASVIIGCSQDRLDYRLEALSVNIDSLINLLHRIWLPLILLFSRIHRILQVQPSFCTFLHWVLVSGDGVDGGHVQIWNGSSGESLISWFFSFNQTISFSVGFSKPSRTVWVNLSLFLIILYLFVSCRHNLFYNFICGSVLQVHDFRVLHKNWLGSFKMRFKM